MLSHGRRLYLTRMERGGGFGPLGPTPAKDGRLNLPLFGAAADRPLSRRLGSHPAPSVRFFSAFATVTSGHVSSPCFGTRGFRGSQPIQPVAVWTSTIRCTAITCPWRAYVTPATWRRDCHCHNPPEG